MVLLIFSKKLPPLPQSRCHLSEIPPVTVFIMHFCFTEIHFSTAVSPLKSWTVGSVCYLSLTLIQPFYLAHKCVQNFATFENKYQ